MGDEMRDYQKRLCDTLGQAMRDLPEPPARVKSNRLRNYVAGERDVLDLLIGLCDRLSRVRGVGDVCVSVPQLVGPPPDAKLLYVHHDPLRRAFCFVVEHESFDDVPFGEQLPVHHLAERRRAVVVRVPPQDADESNAVADGVVDGSHGLGAMGG